MFTTLANESRATAHRRQLLADADAYRAAHRPRPAGAARAAEGRRRIWPRPVLAPACR